MSGSGYVKQHRGFHGMYSEDNWTASQRMESTSRLETKLDNETAREEGADQGWLAAGADGGVRHMQGQPDAAALESAGPGDSEIDVLRKNRIAQMKARAQLRSAWLAKGKAKKNSISLEPTVKVSRAMSRPSSRGASSEPGSQPHTPRNLPSPKDYTAAASEASEFVETCKRSVQSLKAAQEAHVRAVGIVASLCVRGASLASGEVPAGDWPVSQPSFEAQQPALETAQELQRAAALLIEWQSRAAEAEAPLDALVATLNTFLASGVAACSARAATYEAAHREHAQSLTKLQGKADKRKLPALQQTEVEAKAKASHAASGAGEALALLRRDMQTAVLNTARSIGGSQLTLHARGLEQHSRALQALPGSK